MRPRPHPSLAQWLKAQRLQRLGAVYLHELELVAEGLPGGPLRLASALHAAEARERLFAVAARDSNRRWAARLHGRLGAGCAHDDRASLLALAHGARAARALRRAAQLFGWLLLTATADDDAFACAREQLCEMALSDYDAA
ncbi:MAG: hypothetical protein MUC74_01970 [Ideonella sp.]|nr:hypothetical protein [Ideonella sp.]